MQIHIDIERPLSLIVTIAAFGGLLHWIATDPRLVALPAQASVIAVQVQSSSSAVSSEASPAAAVGGDDTSSSERTVQIENQMNETRTLQALLSRKEELLRYQVEVLRQERAAMGDHVSADVEEQFRQSVTALTDLLLDQKKAEAFLLSAFGELFDAEGRTANFSMGTPTGKISFIWPIEPLLGISATFHDPSYKARFGFEHNAVDIPAPQGTLVLAAADGIIQDVVDNGLGFNYIIIKHGEGVATLYGHLSKFSVQPGDRVYAGQPIGYSGGRPGTPGAGFSTGPHLHFGVKVNGQAVDPLPYLPPVRMDSTAGQASDQ